MALDHATMAFLQELARGGRYSIEEQTPAQAREASDALRELLGPGPEVVGTHEERLTTSDDGEFLVRVLAVDRPRGVIVYLHGGGWVIGSLDQCDHLGRLLATRTGCTVVLVDYRLAPEHPHPAAVEDAWAAVRWAADRFAGGPLIVAGDSAGGNLAAVVAQRAGERGGPEIAAQVLVYPVTDHDVDNATYTDPENQLLLSRASMMWFWNHYAPDHVDRSSPSASPLRAESLAGLASAIVLTAEHDPLRQEGEEYARRLRNAGVPVEHRRFEGQMHGFFTMVGVLPGQVIALDYVVDRLDGVLPPR